MDLTQTSESFVSDNQSWLGSAHATDTAETVTLDITTFDLASTFTGGYIPSGVVIAKITQGGNSGMYGPYKPGTIVNESVSLAVNATSGNYTLSFEGQTTANIAFNATAAQVQAALETLADIDVGDITVTGGPGDSGATTPYIITFSGSKYADTDVPPLTAASVNLAGGGASVTPTTTQGGGTGAATDGRQDPSTAMILFHAVKAVNGDTGSKIGSAIWHGQVIESKLPANNGLDSAAKAGGLKLVQFV